MGNHTGSNIISSWPEQSREAAQLVIDTYGQPQEANSSLLIWHNVGPWKRMTASQEFAEHAFPVPHIDSVESFIDYEVPPEMVSSLARFDGSVVVQRTVGEVSARCHDEQANFLALNLMHDIVSGRTSVEDARSYYAQEFLNARRKEPTPYMDKLRFQPGTDTADPDQRALSDQELEQAGQEGQQKSQSNT